MASKIASSIMKASGPHPGSDKVTAVRGGLVYFTDDPFLSDPKRAFVYERDGIVLVRNGVIEAAGPAEKISPLIPAGASVDHYPGCLISAGFIDTHIHYVQTGMIGAPGGGQLLDWLERYTFPAEQEFQDKAHAANVAKVFCDELIRNGTTTALVFCATFPQSVDALFEEAARRNLRLIAGKVLMDRNAPQALLDTPQQAYDHSKALIAKWHGKGRALYAITPRFAITSTPEQLEIAGALWKENPGVYAHTHISENRREIKDVEELFPGRAGYFDVYEHYGLCGEHAVFAHGVHLTEREFCRCHETGTSLSHCPTSNLFLGSGIFSVAKAKDPARPVHIGLGTDIGAGTSFSLLATLNEAYKVSQADNAPLDAIEAFYLATLGGARALRLDGKIGSIKPGLEADLVVLDPAATPLLKFRNARAQSIDETLFALMTLGDDRAVRAVYVAGEFTELSATPSSHQIPE
jgi:guanine deaminase